MEDSHSGRPAADAFHRVEDDAQARMLADPGVLRYFRPFLARETTVGDAAADVDCPPATMLYRVRTFVRAGLLRVVRERPRAGRPIKVYRSAHDAYLVPFARTPHASLEEAFTAVYADTYRRIARAQARRFARSGWAGYRLFRDGDGETWFEGAPDADRTFDPNDPDLPPGFDFTLDLTLPRAEAHALQSQLVSLLEHYRGHATDEARGHGDRYLFTVALVPVEDG